MEAFTNRVFAFLFLVLLSPVFLTIALIILLFDGRPIFYKQVRVGKGRKKFRIFKFRTMIVGADELKWSLMPFNEAAFPYFKMKDDPRITKVGKILRRLSLDELPQLFNILRGEMNFVGVRPVLREEAAYLREERFCVMPGLTGATQVYGRNADIPSSDLEKLELEYVANKSFKTDMRLILRTFAVVAKGE